MKESFERFLACERFSSFPLFFRSMKGMYRKLVYLTSVLTNRLVQAGLQFSVKGSLKKKYVTLTTSV